MGDIFLFDFELSNHIEEINEFNQKKIIHKKIETVLLNKINRLSNQIKYDCEYEYDMYSKNKQSIKITSALSPNEIRSPVLSCQQHWPPTPTSSPSPNPNPSPIITSIKLEFTNLHSLWKIYE
jgi:hypothetical protein